jgi:hypothetical protein
MDDLSEIQPLDRELRLWFMAAQSQDHRLHCSKANRGALEQDQLFERRATRARWKQSSHNFGAAIDTFFLVDGKASWDIKLYFNLFGTIGEDIPEFIRWYGIKEGKNDFWELPHFELRHWRRMVTNMELKAVEDENG